MAETREQLVAQLEKLRDVRATGHRRVETPQGGALEFRSDVELAAAIADLEQRIAAFSGSPVRFTYLTSSKGT